MMTQLRSQMKLILWILVFAFLATIVFSWGMGGFKERGQKPGILAQVGKQEITAEGFEKLIRYKVDQAKSSGEKEPDQEAVKKIREDSWDEQVNNILKQQDARKRNIVVTDREIAYMIENNPPSEIQKVESFQTDGKFDISKYQAFLRDPQATSYLLSLEESVRNYLVEQALTFRVAQAATVTEDEVKDEFLSKTAAGKLKFIALLNDNMRVDSSAATDEMMRRYYQLFKDRFQTFPQRAFAYIKIKLVPSALDSSDVRKEAEDILKQLSEGADFASLAEQYSQDQASTAKGGDLGWFGRGSMVKPFEEAAFVAKPGEIVGPVESRFGWHIIKVEGHETRDGEEQVSARHILLKMEASADTRDQVYNDAYNFAQELKDRNFTEAAQQYGYEIDTTALFSESGYITGLGRMRMAAEFCFASPVGAVSEVYTVPDGYIVFQITQVVEEGYKPFDDAKDTIKRSLVKILNQRKAWTTAAELRGKIETADDLDRVASLAGLMVYETEDTLKPSGALPGGLKKDKDLLTQAFRLDSGELSDVIVGKNGCYIAFMVNKTPFNQDQYIASHSAIYLKMIGDKGNTAVKNWERELRVAANVKDYRYRYYHDF